MTEVQGTSIVHCGVGREVTVLDRNLPAICHKDGSTLVQPVLVRVSGLLRERVSRAVRSVKCAYMVGKFRLLVRYPLMTIIRTSQC